MSGSGFALFIVLLIGGLAAASFLPERQKRSEMRKPLRFAPLSEGDDAELV